MTVRPTKRPRIKLPAEEASWDDMPAAALSSTTLSPVALSPDAAFAARISAAESAQVATGDVASKASWESVLSALSRPPSSRNCVAPLARRPAEAIAPAEIPATGDKPAMSKASAAVGILPDSAAEPAPAEYGYERARLPLTDPGLPEADYRLDAPLAQSDSEPVAPPHWNIIAPEFGDETADAPSGTADSLVKLAGSEGGGGFRPLLQVDHFTWPKACQRLMTTAAAEFEQLTNELMAARERGQKVLAIAGCRRGEGSTTMLLCAAKRLSERGLRVVMVDGDLVEPQLARRLGVLPQFGWESVLAGPLPLAEVLIESAETGLALLPLREPFVPASPWPEGKGVVAESLGTLGANFDLTLVDLGPLEDPATIGGSVGREIGRQLDGVILVQSVRMAARERLAEAQRRLAAAGIAQAGIIENFVHGRPACTKPTGS
jgi:Mrp family chromosome partitioning ATPase